MSNCPHCGGLHTLSQCPTWRYHVEAGQTEMLAALVDAAIEAVRKAAANRINDALAAQHGRLDRMERALWEIKRAAVPEAGTIALLAIADIAAAGLK